MRFNWLSDVAVPLLVAVLRVSWLVPWLELLRRWFSPAASAPLIPVGTLLAVIVSAMIVVRLLPVVIPHLVLARTVAALMGFATLFTTLWWLFYRQRHFAWDVRWLMAMQRDLVSWENELPPAMIAIPILIYLWLRGTYDGRQTLYRDETWGAFIGGFMALALCAVLAIVDGQGLPAGMGGLVFVYFGIGMAAVALASLETAQEAGRRRGEGLLTVNRYWLVSIGSVVIGLLVAGLLVSYLVTPEVVARATAWISIILDILGVALFYVLLVIAFIVFTLLEPLINALRAARLGQQPGEEMGAQDLLRQLEALQRGTLRIPPTVEKILPWLTGGLVIFIIGLAFALALRRFLRRAADPSETREWIFSRDLLVRQLSDLWRSRFGGRHKEKGLGLSPFLSLDGEVEARRIIRQVYQAILATMRERGHARQPSQTPAEYQNELESELPGEHAALSMLTDAYEQARYASKPPALSRVEWVRDVWERLRKELERPKDP